MVDLRTGLVHIKGPNDDHVWDCREVAERRRDVRDDIFVDGADVLLELCGESEMGVIGKPSATVPRMNFRINW
jgi:hypothetical protein